MKKITGALILFFLLVSASKSFATTETGWMKIESMGCHTGDGTCYVTLRSNKDVGPASCRSKSIRWNTDIQKGGKNTLALVTAAFVSGKELNFIVADSCFVHQPSYPTFTHFHIQ